MKLLLIVWVYLRRATGVMPVSLIVISAALTVFPFMLSLLADTAVMEKITMGNMRKITKESMRESMKEKSITTSTVKSAFTLRLNLKR